MVYIAGALIVCAAIGAGVFLAMHEHPWFALLAFLIAGSISIKGD